jgi:hypothetical protein
MKLLGLLVLDVMLLSLVMVLLLAFGQNVLMLLTTEFDMKDGWTIEEYLEFVKHLLEQAEKDDCAVG